MPTIPSLPGACPLLLFPIDLLAAPHWASCQTHLKKASSRWNLTVLPFPACLNSTLSVSILTWYSWLILVPYSLQEPSQTLQEEPGLADRTNSTGAWWCTTSGSSSLQIHAKENCWGLWANSVPMISHPKGCYSKKPLVPAWCRCSEFGNYSPRRLKVVTSVVSTLSQPWGLSPSLRSREMQLVSCSSSWQFRACSIDVPRQGETRGILTLH